jgi:hypothetical protein
MCDEQGDVQWCADHHQLVMVADDDAMMIVLGSAAYEPLVSAWAKVDTHLQSSEYCCCWFIAAV